MTTMTSETSGRLPSDAEPCDKYPFMRSATVRKQSGIDRLIPVHSQTDGARRNRAKELVEANEDLYRHIARELHDDIGQRLSLLSIRLGMLRKVPKIGDTDDKLAQSLRDLDELISDVHNLSHSLHSSRIENIGLVAALRDAFARLSTTHNVRIDFVTTRVPQSLPPDVALSFFRVGQECLNNVIKHSGVSRVQVELKGHGDLLTMRVQDFGSGFDTKDVPEGLGLMAMEERMVAIGGTLSVNSAQGIGTTVIATVELEPEPSLAKV